MARRSRANQAIRNNAIENTEDEPVNLAITVGFLGSILVTLGFVVQNIADAIAISELRENGQNNSTSTSKKEKGSSSKQLNEIQQKLDFLINELEGLKKRG